jgi:hypothetical protein
VAAVAQPVAGTVLAPYGVTTVPEPRQYTFGHPVGYVAARFFAFVLVLTECV